jgi:quercetin dioxygenase-like cupin family protein
MFVTSVERTEAETITQEGVKGMTVRWLLEKNIGVPFEMRYFEVKKAGSCPIHEHDSVQEVFIVKGRGIFVGGDVEKEVKPGDALYIPPHEPHQCRNPYDEIFGFISLIPQGLEDEIKYRTNYGSEAK